MTIEEKCAAIKAGLLANIAADHDEVARLFGEDGKVTVTAEPTSDGRARVRLEVEGDADKILTSVQDLR